MEIIDRYMIVIFVEMGLILFCFAVANREREGIRLHSTGVMLLALCMGMVFSLTGVSPTSGFHTDIRWSEVSYVPLVGLSKMISESLLLVEQNQATVWQQVSYLGVNIGGNILMFMPIGFLLPLLWEKFQNPAETIKTGFAISLLIECSQLFLIRGSDVDDLLLNTAGCALGFVCYKRLAGKFPDICNKISLKQSELTGKGAEFMWKIPIFLPLPRDSSAGVYRQIPLSEVLT